MRSVSILTVLLILVLRLPAGHAQESPVAEENPAPAAEAQVDGSQSPEPAASPPPGEEVMRPTQRGLRFTQKMAQGMGRGIASELQNGPARDRLAEMIERRCWDLKEGHGQEAAVAVEHFCETLLLQEGRGNLPNNNKAMYLSFDAETAREFSRKVSPGAKVLEEFWQGLLEDARQVVPDDGKGEMASGVREALEMTRRFQEKMDRWSRGEVNPKEGLLDGIDEDDIAAEKSGKTTEYIRAERQVRWEVNWRGPAEWEWFLKQCAKILVFDDNQKASGQKLLEEYREKAEKVMTAEWKDRVMANRVRERLRQICPEQPLGPWAFRLDQEYREMTRPINELGVAFHRDVVALARPEQWEQMLASLRKVAIEHGMKPEEVNREFLRLPDKPVASNAAIETSP